MEGTVIVSEGALDSKTVRVRRIKPPAQVTSAKRHDVVDLIWHTAKTNTGHILVAYRTGTYGKCDFLLL